MSTSSARHEAPRNGWPVKRRLIRVLAGSAVIGAMAVGGLQFALGTAYAAGDVCDLCSTNYNPVACCSSGGSAYDSNPGGGIDVSAQKAAFDSYCANYKKEHAQKEEPATPAPRHEAEQPEAIGPGPGEAVLGLAGHPDDEALHGQHHRATVAARAVDRHTVRPEHDGQHSRDHRRHGRERRCHRHSDLEGRGLPEEQR